MAELSVLDLLQVPNNSVIKPLLQQEMVCGACCHWFLTVQIRPAGCFPYFVMSLIPVSYVIDNGCVGGRGRLPDCGEEGGRNFPRSSSLPPGAALVL